jgi:hypothetical protein
MSGSLRWLLVLVIASAGMRVAAQDVVPPPDSSGGLFSRKTIATVVTGGVLAGSLIDSYYSWWRDSNGRFVIHAEGWFRGSRGIDKAGHLFTSYFYFKTFQNLLRWGGYEPKTAFWWAAGLSAFFALSVEIGDGFSEYAFDYQDLVFNTAGVGYGMLQTEVPFLQNFNLKWSYFPEGGYRFPPRFTEHYDGHIYWLTANVNNLLPEGLEPYWPDLLQLGVGYSVADRGTRSEVVVGLDFNLEVFRPSSAEVDLFLRTLNTFHWPAPGVKFTEGRKPDARLFMLH